MMSLDAEAHQLFVARRNYEKCLNCGICDEIVACPCGVIGGSDCAGCGACYISCPNEAIELVKAPERPEIRIRVDGENFHVPEGITVLKALELLGYRVANFPDEGEIFAPCKVGGCYSCAVVVDGSIRPSCVTKIKEGMNISTELPENFVPRRIVHGWMGHPVGGVGTPWWLKGKYYIEAAVFACGCNLRCPQCQNWMTTYNGRGEALDPRRAAILMTDARKFYGVSRMAISGGECTLNRKWLVEYIRELKSLNRDPSARFHVDTNATVLTEEYIDELVEAGMTDIGIDLKGLSVKTFMKITGITDRNLAEKYHSTAWNAFKYLVDNYRDRVFIGVGIPYNRDFISIEEITKIGEEICRIDPEVQVCVLDYRPEFRNRRISRPSFQEMKNVWRTLKSTGLNVVICQTSLGYIGP
uniref:Radical SAM protein n=1 Tax=Geoglobus ahangari TaxID=113653 RepID=A0A7J3TFR0_9EURY